MDPVQHPKRPPLRRSTTPTAAPLVALITCSLTLGCRAGSGVPPRPTTPEPSNAASSRSNRCYARVKPLARSDEAVQQALEREVYCHGFDPKMLATIEQQLRQSYKPMFKPSRVSYAFTCDPVRWQPKIELEAGDEKSRRLRLVNFVLRTVDGEYDVLNVEIVADPDSVRAYDYHSGAQFKITTTSGRLDISRVDEEQVRTALAATIDEVPLSGVTTVVGAFGGGPSIHRLVLLESIHPEYSIGDDGERKYHSVHRRQQRRYTGPLESSSQRDYLPVLIASDALLAALPTEGLATDELEGHRELVVARFRGEFDSAPPWLRDLFLVLAVRLGSAELIPQLAEAARRSEDEERVLAVNALAAITGWDVRFDAQHRPRPISEVAQDYVRECAAAATCDCKRPNQSARPSQP